MSKRKLFFKSFLITFGILSAIGFLMLGKVPHISVPQQNQSSPSPQKAEFIPSDNDKFNLLLSLSKKPDTPPYAYFILNFDGKRQNLNILRLPQQTLLSKEGESKVILSEQFEKGASPLAVRALSKYFDCEISRYIALDNSKLHSLFSLFDPTEIEVSQNLSQIDKQNEIYIKIDKGRQLLSASSMVDLIAASNWQGGLAQTLFESSNALCAFLNQNGDEIFKNSGCKFEKFILNHTVNNFSVMDFEKRRELVCYILNTKSAAHPVEIYGESRAADTEFVIKNESFSKIQKMLQKTVENE